MNPDSRAHTEWSLPVVFKHRDTWLYIITSKRLRNTVNMLYKTYRDCLSRLFDVIIYKSLHRRSKTIGSEGSVYYIIYD